MIFGLVFKCIPPFKYLYIVFKKGDAFKDKTMHSCIYIYIYDMIIPYIYIWYDFLSCIPLLNTIFQYSKGVCFYRYI